MRRTLAAVALLTATAPATLAQSPTTLAEPTGGVGPGARPLVGPPPILGASCPETGTCAHPQSDYGGMTFDDTGMLWTGNFFGPLLELAQVDPATCNVVRTIPAPTYTGGVAFDGTHLWAVSENASIAQRLDPATGAVDREITLPGTGNASGLAWDGQHLWHTDYTLDEILRLDPMDGSVLQRFPSPGTVPSGLDYYAGKLVHADASADRIYVIDPTTGVVESSCAGPGFPWGVAVDGSGAWVSNGGSDRRLVRLDIGLSTGTNYCGPAVPNSSGSSASMSGGGSLDVATNAFELRATGLPQNAWGYFLNSRTSGFQAMPGGSQGNLCLGNPVGRHVLQVANSGAAGEIAISPDLAALPTPTGTVAVLPGETWYFQCWFRDANPAVTSNFTDGLEVDFL